MFESKLIYQDRYVEIYTPSVPGLSFRSVDDKRIRGRVDLEAGLLIEADRKCMGWNLNRFEANSILYKLEEMEETQKIGNYFFQFDVEEVAVIKEDRDYPDFEQKSFLMKVDEFRELHDSLPEYSSMHATTMIGIAYDPRTGVSRLFDYGS